MHHAFADNSPPSTNTILTSSAKHDKPRPAPFMSFARWRHHCITNSICWFDPLWQKSNITTPQPYRRKLKAKFGGHLFPGLSHKADGSLGSVLSSPAGPSRARPPKAFSWILDLNYAFLVDKMAHLLVLTQCDIVWILLKFGGDSI